MASPRSRAVGWAEERPFGEMDESFYLNKDGEHGNVVGVMDEGGASFGGEAETPAAREVSLDKWRSMASTHFRDAIRDAAQPSSQEHDTTQERRYQQNLLLRDVYEALEMPSIYLLQAVRRVDGAHKGSTVLLADLTCFFVWVLEVGFPLWFVGNYAMRRSPTLLAPGIHTPRKHTAVRVKWMHNFSVDLAASVFLLYVAWSNWQRRTLRTFRFFMRPDPTSNLRKSVVVLGMLSQMANILLIIIITYILFRLQSVPHGILLNAVAMDWIGHIDKMLVESFNRQSALRRYVAACRRQLAVCAQAQLSTNALAEIRTLRTSGAFELVRSCSAAVFFRGKDCHRRCRRESSEPRSSISSKPTATFPVPLDTLRSDQLCVELVLRIFKGFTAYLVFCLWIMTATGGHIAHTHVMTIIKYFNFAKRTPIKSSLDAEFPTYEVKIRRCKNRHKHIDACYVGPAFIHITLLFIVLRLALRFGRRCMPRRYAVGFGIVKKSGKPRTV